MRFCKSTLEERGKYTTRIRARIYDGRNIYVSWTFYSEINTYSYTDGKRVYKREIIYGITTIHAYTNTNYGEPYTTKVVTSCT